MGGQKRVWKIYGGAGVWGDLEQRVWKERGGVSQHSPGTDPWWWNGKWIGLSCTVFVSLSPALTLLAGCPWTNPSQWGFLSH